MTSPWLFFKEFLKHPSEVAAVLPTSRSLANAMVESGLEIVGSRFTPLKVLEIGAGTGAVTQRLVRALSPKDELVVVETNTAFFHKLQENVSQLKKLHGTSCPKIKTIHGNFPEILENSNSKYHWVITSVPFNAFSREKAFYLFNQMYNLVGDRGVLVFQDYLFLRKINNWVRSWSSKWTKTGIPKLKTIFDESSQMPMPRIHRHFVLWNVPPAIAFCLEKTG